MISGALFGLGAFAVIVISSKILFPNAKIFVLIKGFFSGWVEDKTKTPEGAKAVYDVKIQELQDSYNKANDALRKIVGQYTTTKNELENYKEELKKIEENCNILAKKQKWKEVEELAESREDLVSEVELRQKLLSELSPQLEEAKMINEKLETTLVNMKKEKNRVIRELTAKKQLKSIYDEMDELKNVSPTSQMVQTVREGLKEATEEAEGAKVLYNSKKSTRRDKIEQEIKKSSTSSYVEQLKEKYNNTTSNSSRTIKSTKE